MGCTIQINLPSTPLNYSENSEKQKLWVKALLHCTQLDINDLAIILDLPTHGLHKIHQGELILTGDKANRLAQLFFIAFGA